MAFFWFIPQYVRDVVYVPKEGAYIVLSFLLIGYLVKWTYLMKTTNDTTVNVLFSTGFFWIDSVLIISIALSFAVICCLGSFFWTLVYCIPHYLSDETVQVKAVVEDDDVQAAVARVIGRALTKPPDAMV